MMRDWGRTRGKRDTEDGVEMKRLGGRVRRMWCSLMGMWTGIVGVAGFEDSGGASCNMRLLPWFCVRWR